MYCPLEPGRLAREESKVPAPVGPGRTKKKKKRISKLEKKKTKQHCSISITEVAHRNPPSWKSGSPTQEGAT